ncbi:DUF547 domain-containing protein [Porphyrobacter sp. YT40]|uniref:DUF547 domain-containing protein n=1 Tax=Porphyrobacter sp. YT40 TaxID=2547601 RepID=UPI0011432540|nr:DUF547 domain-containing protein [Porphyrobacter sp. YT40]QDH35770.1 DUF547 domain-containing protein [Porphyrobacter sp. YT40]
MRSRLARLLLTAAVLTLPGLAAAEAPATRRQSDTRDRHYVPAMARSEGQLSLSDSRLAIFTPTSDPIRHTIDYEVWDYALKNILVAMGPSNRQGMRRPDPPIGSRRAQGPQSRYRLEGSMVLFRFFDKDVIDSFTEYREDLERVAGTLDISALPRNEQLAFWLNLHNVAMMEMIAKEWPVREPREIKVGGVPLDDAKFITLRGIPVSLRDIREEIVFRNWINPKVIYGFWRGEIGGPELQRHAFTGDNVGSLLDVAAADFVNSLRGTQMRGDRLEVASLYAEVAPFYFGDFEGDLRRHLAEFAEGPTVDMLAGTREVSATISEHDIADLHGGARPPNYLFAASAPGAMDDPLVGCKEEIGFAACELMQARETKLRNMERRGERTGRVFVSNISLPGDPPNQNAVE